MMFELDTDDSADFCFPTLKPARAAYKNECRLLDDFDFGTALQNVYPILRIIFKNLNYRDLKSAALVNATWQKYANEELQQRNKPSWVILNKSHHKLCLEVSKHFKYNEISFGIIFYNYKCIRPKKYVCVHDKVTDNRSHDSVERMTFIEYLSKEIVPKDVAFWLFSCRNIYNIHDESKRCKTVFSTALLPTIPKVKVRTFHFNVKSAKTEGIENVLQENLPITEKVGCLLIFILRHGPVNAIVETLARRQGSSNFALGGAVVPGGVKFCNYQNPLRVHTSYGIHCIALTTDATVTDEFGAYSIVISKECDYEMKILELKEKVVMRQNSFALRFCCTLKTDKEKETPIFNKHFPDTFILGMDGDGEIGWNNSSMDFSEGNEPNKKKSKVVLPEVWHNYSTVLVVVTWGRQKK